MQFGLKHLLIFMTLIAVLIVGVVYAFSTFDGLTLIVIVGGVLLNVVLPAAVIGTVFGIWRRKRQLAMVCSGTLGGIVGLLAGAFLTGMLENLAFASVESIVLTVVPALTALGVALGCWLSCRIVQQRV